MVSVSALIKTHVKLVKSVNLAVVKGNTLDVIIQSI